MLRKTTCVLLSRIPILYPVCYRYLNLILISRNTSLCNSKWRDELINECLVNTGCDLLIKPPKNIWIFLTSLSRKKSTSILIRFPLGLFRPRLFAKASSAWGSCLLNNLQPDETTNWSKHLRSLLCCLHV